jgi:hypothetical protein
LSELRYTLVADGTSDRVLLPILRWLLIENRVRNGLVGKFADYRNLTTPPGRLDSRISLVKELYPCELLFIHRDAERQSPQQRRDEIRAALERVFPEPAEATPAVCIIPIRMTEAWLLFDEHAIRTAAANPNGTLPLALPPLETVEALPNPKDVIYQLLNRASGLLGRRQRGFSPQRAVHHLARNIDDFSPLRRLSAFQSLEADLTQILERMQLD